MIAVIGCLYQEKDLQANDGTERLLGRTQTSRKLKAKRPVLKRLTDSLP
jgi:hypothetical protein